MTERRMALSGLLGEITSASQPECAAILAAVASRLAAFENTRDVPSGAPPSSDELLDVQQVAALLSISTRSVRRRSKTAPLRGALIRSLGRHLLFSRQRIERMIAREAGTDPFTLGLRGLNTGRRARTVDRPTGIEGDR